MRAGRRLYSLNHETAEIENFVIVIMIRGSLAWNCEIYFSIYLIVSDKTRITGKMISFRLNLLFPFRIFRINILIFHDLKSLFCSFFLKSML